MLKWAKEHLSELDQHVVYLDTCIIFSNNHEKVSPRTFCLCVLKSLNLATSLPTVIKVLTRKSIKYEKKTLS